MERLRGALLRALGCSRWNAPFVGFDIETYSPNGFPAHGEDPIVAATLAVSPSFALNSGLMLISMIFPPSKEGELLSWLHAMLELFSGGSMVTYNGWRFDLPYVIHRGRLHGLNLEWALGAYHQLDVYKAVRAALPTLPSYRQKAVEDLIGVERLTRGISGESYHKLFDSFMQAEDLRPVIYNVEDSVGCLRILNYLATRVLNDADAKRGC
jgi:uncharacterized protein YprB with RNaseH-like and TPR domain